MKRLLNYMAVGAGGVIVNEGLLYFFTDLVGLFLVVSSIIAIEASIISNFMLNDAWTFRDRIRGSKISRGAKFNIVSLGSLLINVTVLYLFTNILGVYYLISNLAGIGVAFFWNYAINFYWTWRS